LLFVLTFSVYISHTNTFETADTIPARLIPILLLTQGDLRFDRYLQVFDEKYPHLKGDMYFLRHVSDRYISGFPVTPGLLLTPFYTPFVLYKQRLKPTPDQWMKFADGAERIAAASIASAGIVVLYFVLVELGAGLAVAALLALIDAFATNAFVTFSQQLWQHGFTVLFMLLSLFLSMRFSKGGNRWRFLLVGAFAGLAVACRPTSIVFLCALCAWLLLQKRDSLLPLAAGAVAALAPIIAYNHTVYGNVFGGYSVYLGTARYALSKASVLAALLVSPGRGLFFYFPLGILSLWGLYFAFRKFDKQRFLYGFLAVFCVGQLVLIWWFRWNNDWFGGHCWGPRYLSETQFALVILLVPLLQHYANLAVTALIGLLAIISVGLQTLGVYVRNDWNALPVDINVLPARAWSLADSPISRALPARLWIARKYIEIPLDPVRISAAEPVKEESIEGRTVISVNAPSEIALKLDKGTRTVRGFFGIVPGAYSDGGRTDGVEFLVEFVDNRSIRTTLFRRYLQPLTVPSDRGMQQFSVSLAGGPGEIDLLARCGPQDNHSWDWAYWSEVKLDR
jgi:hypothetical protein